MRFLACVPIDAASTRESRSHKAVNQLDFEVTQPRRVIVGDVGYCISRNLIRVAMSHICYLFEGLTFSLWFGAFAPCRSGIDFTMPAKGSRAAHDNRKVCCQLPEIRSSLNNEEDFRLLAMKTEGIRRRLHTFASEIHLLNAKEWLARTSGHLAEQLMARRKGQAER